jgi:N4-gp56 family major capsid protein
MNNIVRTLADLHLRAVNLQLFDDVLNATTSEGLSGEMKTYYDDTLIDNAEPKLVHNQFGQKKPIPKGKGKTIEFRKYAPLPKLTTPLSEGVTPAGQTMSMSVMTASVAQYGGFIMITDILTLTAIDNNLQEAAELLGSQAGRSLDTITREVLVGGTNVVYGGTATARHLLAGGEASGNSYITVDAIKRAVRVLKIMNADPIEGQDFVAIIHPDCTYDLTNDAAWQKPHEYVDTENLYSGEIGRIAGVRFIETTEAKKIVAAPLIAATEDAEAVYTLTIAETLSVAGKTVKLDEALTSAQATALVGRKIILEGKLYTVKGATAKNGSTLATLTVADADSNISTTDGADGKVIYPGEAGAKGRDVYCTLIFAKNAYGVTELQGGGLEFIYKGLGSAGSADPLNQRQTAGWKATSVAKRLVEEFMVRIETTSSFNDHIEN